MTSFWTLAEEKNEGIRPYKYDEKKIVDIKIEVSRLHYFGIAVAVKANRGISGNCFLNDESLR
jgi:autonomous glycyl radical cofactor GrcA